MKSKLLIVIIAAATLMSCSTTKDNKLPYFKDLRNQQHGTLPNPENEYVVLVQPDDELVITVSSVVPEVNDDMAQAVSDLYPADGESCHPQHVALDDPASHPDLHR